MISDSLSPITGQHVSMHPRTCLGCGNSRLTCSPCIPVYNLQMNHMSINTSFICFSSYHRPLETLGVALQPLDSIRLIFRALNQVSGSLRANILQDAPQLVSRRCIFDHVEFKFRSLDLVLRAVVGGLVLRGRLAGIGRSLLEQRQRPSGRW